MAGATAAWKFAISPKRANIFRSFPRKRESRAALYTPDNLALGPRLRGDERLVDQRFMCVSTAAVGQQSVFSPFFF
jgi:hypothetical protein